MNTTDGMKVQGLTRRRAAIALGATAASAALYLATSATGRGRPVFIARGQSYSGPLDRTVQDGLRAVGIDPALFRGKTVLLKPNLVEPNRATPHASTHPAVVVATSEVFRRHGARVLVADGPGHVRDTELALFESGYDTALGEAALDFVDLNRDDVTRVANRGGRSALDDFFPRTVTSADLVVSLPKLKTHHWVGMTAAMKNLFGVFPGGVYGWPKNVLHHHGIVPLVHDIARTLPRTAAVVDAIDCMEGDGPIIGDLKRMGLLLVGRDLGAVDTVCAHLMGLAPERIEYLRLMVGRYELTNSVRVDERGERWRELAQPFRLPDLPHLIPLHGGSPGVPAAIPAGPVRLSDRGGASFWPEPTLSG